MLKPRGDRSTNGGHTFPQERGRGITVDSGINSAAEPSPTHLIITSRCDAPRMDHLPTTTTCMASLDELVRRSHLSSMLVMGKWI